MRHQNEADAAGMNVVQNIDGINVLWKRQKSVHCLQKYTIVTLYGMMWTVMLGCMLQPGFARAYFWETNPPCTQQGSQGGASTSTTTSICVQSPSTTGSSSEATRAAAAGASTLSHVRSVLLQFLAPAGDEEAARQEP